MRGKLARNLRRKGAIERIRPQLERYQEMRKLGDESGIKIKTKGIKKSLTPMEALDLKIARVLMVLERTEQNLREGS